MSSRVFIATMLLSSIGALGGVVLKFEYDMEDASARFRSEQHQVAKNISREVENAFGGLYQGLSTIARLPYARRIESNGYALDANARVTIRELCFNLADTLALESVFIVPVTPAGQVAEPVIAFHDAVVDDTTGVAGAAARPESVCLSAARMEVVRNQLRTLRDTVPHESGTDRRSYPFLIGDPDAKWNMKQPIQTDALIASVPLFDVEGRLIGCVAAVIPNSVVQRMVPSSHYALVKPRQGLLFRPLDDQRRFDRFADRAITVPGLLYSEVIRMRMPDRTGEWRLWSMASNATFADRRDVRIAAQFRDAAIIAILLMSGILVFFAQYAERKNKYLEGEVNERTSKLLHAQKMESIGQLAAGIAHEINTPTQYIGDNVRFLDLAYRRREAAWRAYQDLLQKVGDGTATPQDAEAILNWERDNRLAELREEIPRAIAECLEGVDRVSGIVAAMKDYAHPGIDHAVDINLNQTIESTVTVARNEWKNIADIELELFPSLPSVHCNPGEIGQVILNLVVNAAHAIKSKSDRTERGLIRVASCKTDDWVVVTVSDNGSGIPDEIKERIFEQFFTTKESGVGTGLGLAIVRRVVEAHSGRIEFDSKVGVGSTFWIYLPITRKSSSESEDLAA